jgi:predicted HNH restriction endonuclease
LRNYVEVNPEELTHLVDDVAAYLDPAQGANDPGSPTNILAEVVSFAPGRVADFREQIEELQDHDKEYVQQYCSIILETLDEMDYTSTSERKATDSDWSSNKQGRDTASSSAEADETESEQMLDDLREAAEQDSVETVPKETTTTTQETKEYSRSKKVKQYVKARANGYCEGCGDPAPFTSKTGEPYLHAHHVHEISDGGSDTPETVIALCPNCHYRVHHGEDGELYNEELITQLKEIEA